MKRRIPLLMLAVGMAVGPTLGSAQTGPPGPPRQRQQLERRLEQGLARLVQAQLGLTAEQMAPLQEVMQSFRADRQAVHQAQAALRYRLRNPDLDQVPEEEARDILAEMVRVQEAELELYRNEQDRLLTVLSPNQLVRFYRIRDEWGQRIQQMRQPGEPRGPGGRGNGAFPGGMPHSRDLLR